MRKKFIIGLIFILFSCILVFSTCNETEEKNDSPINLDTEKQDKNLVVNYTYQDKKYKVEGKKIDDNTFVFNEGAEKRIWITTLNWSPYVGSELCKQGWVQQLTIALLSANDYEIKSTFYPWARTIKVAEEGTANILYPEYYIEDTAPSDVFEGTKRVEHLAISRKIPGGPIAFMKRKGDNINFDGNLEKLKGEKIGVVRGYQNTPEFDALMDKEFFDITEVPDDLTNAKILSGGRVK
ncbi:MAG: hypothetical protein ACOCUI_05750, partial [bacterium]